ncbi:MAG: SusD/RagB family nutrient-binding outer membrane lipoprotein [Bacteroidota bacterium]
MHNSNLITAKNLFLFLLTFLLISCSDFLNNEINEDPNNPTEVPITVILPNAQVNIADFTGGEFSRFASTLTQQTQGVSRAWFTFYRYSSLTPASFNTVWNNVYENALIETTIINDIAEREGFSHYQAASNILTAYTLMLSTDVWDDMPYSEALNGFSNTSPDFDSQQELYQEINNLLNNAITLLQNNDGGLPLGSEDIIYRGDTSLWIKASYALIARMHLHQKNYSEALLALQNSFTSADDNFNLQYFDETSSAPWYRFNRDRTGDIEFNPTMRTIMENLNDTIRLSLLDRTFVAEHPYFIPTYDQDLISYRELKFIEAECLLRTNATGSEIREAYLKGVNASFEHFGAEGYNDYVSQGIIDPGIGNITLEHIITQKYIGLFTHPEVYTDWRRTDIPELFPVTGSQIPVRYPYGSDEILFNANAPEEDEVNIFSDRVGWNR